MHSVGTHAIRTEEESPFSKRVPVGERYYNVDSISKKLYLKAEERAFDKKEAGIAKEL